jgi:hypothetical protein
MSTSSKIPLALKLSKQELVSGQHLNTSVNFPLLLDIKNKEIEVLTAAAWPYQSALPVASEQQPQRSEGSGP